MMTIIPSPNAKKIINLPYSKSQIIRYLLVATLTKTPVTLDHITYCDDVLAAISLCQSVGAKFSLNDDQIIISDFQQKTVSTFEVKESATLLRLVIPSIIDQHQLLLKTSGTLKKRSIDFYQNLYEPLSISFLKSPDGIIINNVNKTHPSFNHLVISHLDSSQYLSGLLIDGAINHSLQEISVIKPFESAGYVDLTIDCLNDFGYVIEKNETDQLISYELTQVNKITNIHKVIDIDYSSAAYYFALGLLNDDLILKNYLSKTLQPDYAFLKMVECLHGQYQVKNDDLIVYRSYLEGTTLNLSNNPDLAPILMVLGCFTNNFITLEKISRLKFKESDRIKAMSEELAKIGVKVIDVDEDTITIDNSHIKYDGCHFKSHHDHRIAMALIVLATVLNTKSTIDEVDCINKSNPDFIKTIASLNIQIL